MSFNIKGAKEEVLTCLDCRWCQTKKHFADGPSCTMCGGDAEKVEDIEPSVGISDLKYRKLLTSLEEDAAGVGAATVSNIESHFEEGDDFLDAAEAAHQEMEMSSLEAVDGVGSASAKEIALTMAEQEGWEDGSLFVL